MSDQENKDAMGVRMVNSASYVCGEIEAATQYLIGSMQEKIVMMFSDSQITSAFHAGVVWQIEQEKGKEKLQEDPGEYTLSKKSCGDIADYIVKALTPPEENEGNQHRTMFSPPLKDEDNETQEDRENGWEPKNEAEKKAYAKNLSEFDDLEKEWNEDLKHRKPHMAEDNLPNIPPEVLIAAKPCSAEEHPKKKIPTVASAREVFFVEYFVDIHSERCALEKSSRVFGSVPTINEGISFSLQRHRFPLEVGIGDKFYYEGRPNLLERVANDI